MCAKEPLETQVICLCSGLDLLKLHLMNQFMHLATMSLLLGINNFGAFQWQVCIGGVQGPLPNPPGTNSS